MSDDRTAADALFARLRVGDSQAFDAIFRTWYAPLVRVAVGVVRERAIAEEIVQDVMLELWRRREALAIAGSARAYLIQATRNRALNHVRRLRVERRGEPFTHVRADVEPVGTRHVVEHELDAAIHAAIAALPPRCREVFELSRMHGLRYAEIAAALDISVKTVEAQMGKALRILRDRLAPYLAGEDVPRAAAR